MSAERELGSYLRSAREDRELSLADLSAATKIPIRSLAALEAERWEDLPADVFVRGFVRSCARHLGLPEEDACARLCGRLAADRAAADEAKGEPVGPAAVEVSGRRRFGLALVVIILLIIATITLSLLWRGGGEGDRHALEAEAAPPTASART